MNRRTTTRDQGGQPTRERLPVLSLNGRASHCQQDEPVHAVLSIQIENRIQRLAPKRTPIPRSLKHGSPVPFPDDLAFLKLSSSFSCGSFVSKPRGGAYFMLTGISSDLHIGDASISGVLHSLTVTAEGQFCSPWLLVPRH